jgi:hypothetical protein
MLEFAFVSLPFLALVLGTIDFGMALFIRATMQHAVREGVRYAVTYQTMEGSCQDASIRKTVQNQAMGFLNDEQAEQFVKVEYFLPETLSPTSDNSPGNIVEVSVDGFQYRWICPLWRSATPMNVLVRSSDRMEGLPGGGVKPCR